MAVQPQQMPEFSPVVQATEHESDLDAVTRSLLNPEPEGEQPDPEDSPADEQDDAEALDPADAEEDQASADPEDEDEDDPQESDDDEEELVAGDDEEPDDEVEELTGDTTFEVKVNGEVQQVTLDELRRNYSGNQAIDARIQEASEAKKAAAEELETLRAERGSALMALQLANQILEQEADPDIDWEALYQVDPNEWAQQRELQRLRQERRQALGQAMQQQHEQEQRANQKALEEETERQAHILADAFPVFREKEAGRKRRDALNKFAIDRYGKYGLTPEILQGVNMAIPLIMLGEIYDLVNGTEANPKPKKKRKVRRTVRPGSGTRETPNTRSKKRRESLENRAWESGHVNDVAQTMFVDKPK